MNNKSITKVSLALFIAFSTIAVGQTDKPQSEAKSKIALHFELFAPKLESDSRVFITGSLKELGNWNPAETQMKSLGNNRWTYQITSPANYPIEYKYTLGSWAKEGADSSGRPLANFAIRPKKDTTIKDQIEFWTDGQTAPVSGQITGTVQYHRQLQFEGLQPRDVVVWLPPGYENSNDRYPVLYMHDGQNIVDPKTSAFGKDWQIDESCTRLLESKKIKPIIVVGIYNTSDRSKEYLPGQHGQLYAKFITTKLKPLIDQSYRTRPNRESTAIGGSSAGGVCAFRIAWDQSDIFSTAICMSPSFRYERHNGTHVVNYVSEFEETPKPKQVPFFYIDNGGIGLEVVLQKGIDAMLEAMQVKGLKAGQQRSPDCNYIWKKYPQARHDEAAWADRFPAVLELLYSR